MSHGWLSRLRSYFVFDPLIWLYTLVLGIIAVPAGLFDRGGRLLHWFSYVWSWLIIKTILSPVKVTGLDKIDTSKPHVYAVNHASALDIPVVYVYLPFQFRIAFKKELLSYPVVGWHLKRSGQVCIDQQNPAHSISSIRAALKGLKAGLPLVIYPASGTGAWEAALSNALSPGDRVLMYETGHFATLWKNMALKLGLVPEFISSDWRAGADPKAIEARLKEDTAHAIKAVCVVHNETATGCVSHIDQVRKAIDAAGHPALLMVDTISSLASIDYRHDEWGVDVTVGGSQKGLMLPPGLSFNAVGETARRKTVRLRSITEKCASFFPRSWSRAACCNSWLG